MLENVLKKARQDPRFDEDLEREIVQADPVHEIKFHRFVSYSKGWRNGKQRLRKHWKEIRLLSFQNGAQLKIAQRLKGGKFTQWHRFPFDEVADVIKDEAQPGKKAEPYELENRLMDIYGI